MGTPESGRRTRRWLSLFYALPVLFVLGIIGDAVYMRVTHHGPPKRKISVAPFATIKIQGLDAHLFAQGDALRASGNDLFIEFRDAQGKLTDVGEVEFMLAMNILSDGKPSAVEHSMGKVMRTATPGQYRSTLDPGLAGLWTATLSFSGPRGKAEASIPLKVL